MPQNNTQEKDRDILEMKRLKKREKMKRYRENLKRDIDRYENHKSKERERKRAEYKKVIQQTDPDVLRENKRLKMQAYRAKKKQKNPNPPRPKEQSDPDILISPARRRAGKRNVRKGTKSKMAEKREIEKLRKQSAVKRTQKWRLVVKLKNSESATVMSSASTELSSKQNRTPTMPKTSEWRLMKKARDVLPETPRRRAHIIQRLAQSPQCESYLRSKGALVTPHMKKKLDMGQRLLGSLSAHIEQVKHTGNAKPAKNHAYRILKNISRVRLYSQHKKHITQRLNNNRNLQKKHDTWWEPAKRKARKDKLSPDTQREVQNFFLLPEVSRDVPNKKDVVRIVNEEGEKVQVQKKVMVLTLNEAYNLYKASHPGTKLGMTAFYKLKPSNVRRISETSRRCCLCTTCCNVSLKTEALVKFIKQSEQRFHDLPTVKKQLSSLTMCHVENNEDPAASCLARECQKCGTKSLKATFKELLKKRKKDDIPFNKWTYVKTDHDGKTKSIISCVQKVVTFEDFFDEMMNDLEGYPAHYFRALWQQKQLATCIRNIPRHNAVMVLDYSENYMCRFQNEVQSAFFDQTQVTLLPMMLYYKIERGEKTFTMKHSVIGITDDTKHDSDGVKIFEDAVLAILQKQRNGTVTKVHQFSDGCAAQFKGRRGFADVTLRQGFVQRNFFETSHGKSVCDGLGAVVKNACHHAVLSGKNILSSAQDVYKFCVGHLEQDDKFNKIDATYSKREFVFVDSKDVQRAPAPYELETRQLSCYCDGCFSETDTGCSNLTYTGDWTKVTLELNNASSKHVVAKPPGVSKNKKTRSTNQTRKDEQKDSPVSSVNTDDLADGDFVALRVIGKKRSLLYTAMILDASSHDGEILVKYMKQSGTHYIWPEADDIFWETLDNVICKLSEPHLKNGREQYSFNPDELKSANNLI